MANDLNRCEFIGRLGADPEVRHMANGDAVCNFRIACGSSWKDKATGDKKESVEWIPISVFGKLAEICGTYLTKGKMVFIAGRFRTRKWQDKDGQDRYTTEINADDMQMLGGKSDDRPAASTAAPVAADPPFEDQDIPF